MRVKHVVGLVLPLVACGPSIRETETGGVSGSSSSGLATDSETEAATDGSWSVEDLRPWFGDYHLFGPFGPELDRPFPEYLRLQNVRFLEDGTLEHHVWHCDRDAAEPVRVYAWVQTGRRAIRVDGWVDEMYLGAVGDPLWLDMGEACDRIKPRGIGTEHLERGLACWVDRCEEYDSRAFPVPRVSVEITLCEGESTACEP